jgi:hypothetical protein
MLGELCAQTPPRPSRGFCELEIREIEFAPIGRTDKSMQPTPCTPRYFRVATCYGPIQSNGMCLLDFPAQFH